METNLTTARLPAAEETLRTEAALRLLPMEERRTARQAEGARIDPEVAEIFWGWADLLDPYGDEGNSGEHTCIGRAYFARAAAPRGSLWVWTGDMPEATAARIHERLEQEGRDSAPARPDGWSDGSFPWDHN